MPNMRHAFSWPPNITIFYPLPLPTFSRIKYTNFSTQCENSVKIGRGMDKLSVIRCVGDQILQCVLCFTPLFSLLALQLYKLAKQECYLNATPRKDRDNNSLTDPPFPLIIYPLCRSNQNNKATKFSWVNLSITNIILYFSYIKHGTGLGPMLLYTKSIEIWTNVK